MMQLEGPLTLPYTGTTDLARYRRVKITSGEPAYAGAADEDIGELSARAVGTPTSGATPLGAGVGATVIPKGTPGVHWMVAAGAIAQFAPVYAAADGKVSATVNGFYIGIAWQAAAEDGDEIGVMRAGLTGAQSEAVDTVIVDADNRTVTAAESGTTFVSTGSAGAGTFAMPAATVGLNYTFHVNAAQELRIDPNGSETIGLPSSGVQGAAGKYLTANAVGEWVKVKCVVAGAWTIEGFAGTWTAEA